MAGLVLHGPPTREMQNRSFSHVFIRKIGEGSYRRMSEFRFILFEEMLMSRSIIDGWRATFIKIKLLYTFAQFRLFGMVVLFA